MAKVLVLYYSTYGHIEEMAEAVAEGARGASAEVDIRRVRETVPEEVAKSARFKLDQAAPVATIAELEQYDAIIVGTGTRFGRILSQMAAFLDQVAFKALATLLSGVLLALAPLRGGAFAQQPNSVQQAWSDEALANSLPGTFVSKSAIVNGVKLHYVVGGQGAPLFLLPGWPQTWWEFRKVMPELSKYYRVIAVDLRGMGGSEKPRSGYDKKNMAKDIYELARALGYDKIKIAGHDIGAMVAYSYAANYPKAVDRIALIDVAHPDKDWLDLPLLPNGQEVGGAGEATRPVYLWWFAFNQVDELPGKLLAGRSRLLIDWLFDTQLRDLSSIDERDRAIYAAAYSSAEAIRSGNAWYQTFGQDIQDGLDYPPVEAPLLGLIGERNYPYLRIYLPRKGKNVTVLKVNRSSHYVPEEQPAEVVQRLKEFFR